MKNLLRTEASPLLTWSKSNAILPDQPIGWVLTTLRSYLIFAASGVVFAFFLISFVSAFLFINHYLYGFLFIALPAALPVAIISILYLSVARSGIMNDHTISIVSAILIMTVVVQIILVKSWTS
jgi:hypothetical protein